MIALAQLRYQRLGLLRISITSLLPEAAVSEGMRRLRDVLEERRAVGWEEEQAPADGAYLPLVSEDEVVGGLDAVRPLHQVSVPQQCDDVAGAGRLDGVMQAGERADVNHEIYIASRLQTRKCRTIPA